MKGNDIEIIEIIITMTGKMISERINNYTERRLLVAGSMMLMMIGNPTN